MEIEYEATFTNIDKEKMRKKLIAVGSTLEKKEFLQKRTTFNLPESIPIKGAWARVRDEGDKITMSIKAIDGDKIHNQKEICLTVDNYQEAAKFMRTLGCIEKAYQETKRELWLLDEVEITIDTWPFLEPIIEVEGKSEELVKSVSEKIGMNWKEAKFCGIDNIYAEKYGITKDKVNNETPKILFEMENPFFK